MASNAARHLCSARTGRSARAGLGRDGERVYVNSASGNLVVTRQDEFLIGVGPDLSLDRTYNSQTAIGDGDNMTISGRWASTARWSAPTGRCHDHPPRLGRIGDRLHQDRDGLLHLSPTDGAGAYDMLTWSSAAGGQWTWTDGDTRIKDTYDSSGKLTGTLDPDGNALSYHYDGSLIDHVTTADGDTTKLIYDHDHAGRLLRLETWKSGVTARRS